MDLLQLHPLRFPTMPRKPRLDVSGGLYHVLARGNHRATIFYDDADYRAYLERLERYRHRDGVTLHAYVLMPNPWLHSVRFPE